MLKNNLNNKLDLKRITILALLFIIVISIIGKYIWYELTDNILFFLLSALQQSILFTAVMGIIIINVLPIIILRKTNEVELTSKHMPIIVLIITVIFIISLSITDTYDRYVIDGKRVYGIEMVFNTFKDVMTNKTIEIEAYDYEIIHEKELTRKYKYNKYYLSINEGEYIIPIGNKNKVLLLLYNYSYGENAINKIETYKNSKIIKAINGIKLSAKDDEIYEFAQNKQYKINIVLQPNKQTITYQTIGCTLNELLKNEDIYLSIFDKNDRAVFEKYITKGEDVLPVNLIDGKYRAYVCTHVFKLEKISNGIEYEIKNGEIQQIKQQN